MSDDIPECNCVFCHIKQLQAEIERLREERDTYRNAMQNLTGQKTCRGCNHIDICTCRQADWQPSSLAVWASNILLAYAEKPDLEGGE